MEFEEKVKITKSMTKAYLILFLSFFFIADSFSIRLTDQSEIRLVTCSPGEDLYSVFGHSAIRVVDEANQIDLVYNYGTFDFNTPNFYLKFANGNLKYMLSIGRYKYFLPSYFQENRSVSELILNLPQAEKQQLFDRLTQNSLPENKFYRYDFFFDNCATRLRDMVFNSVEGRVILNDSLASRGTYRQLYGSFLNHSPWTQWGIHLLLGCKADQPSNAYDEMYLPDFLAYQFINATVVNLQGERRPLVLKEEKTLKFEPNNAHDKFLSPVTIFWFIFIVVAFLSLKWRHQNNHLIWFDRILFFSSGLVGILLIFLWFFSNHSVTSCNYNVLWAFPLNVILPFFISSKKSLHFIKYYLIIISSMLFVLTTCWWLLPQEFPNGLFPLILTFLFRSVMLIMKEYR